MTEIVDAKRILRQAEFQKFITLPQSNHGDHLSVVETKKGSNPLFRGIGLPPDFWSQADNLSSICYTFFLQRIRSEGNFGPGGISGLISNLQLSPSSSKLSKIFLIKRKSSSTWLGTKTTLMSFRSVFKILRSLKLRAGESWNIL